MLPLIVPQIIGLAAVCLFLLSYQMKSRGGIIAMNLTSRILYVVQYLLLGAISGAVLDILGSVASLVAGKRNAPFMKKHIRLVFVLMNTAIVGAGIGIAIANRSALDLLPIFGVLLHTGAFWLTRERVIRIVSLIGSPFWLTYNFASRAYGSALGDLLTMGSIVIALIKYRGAEKVNESDEA
jgi:hypothetical protein